MNNKFVSAVTEFEKRKANISFKIDIVNFINRYPKMRKSCISLSYLQNNFLVIKNVCQEHASEFHVFWSTFFDILKLTHFKPVFIL